MMSSLDRPSSFLDTEMSLPLAGDFNTSLEGDFWSISGTNGQMAMNTTGSAPGGDLFLAGVTGNGQGGDMWEDTPSNPALMTSNINNPTNAQFQHHQQQQQQANHLQQQLFATKHLSQQQQPQQQPRSQFPNQQQQQPQPIQYRTPVQQPNQQLQSPYHQPQQIQPTGPPAALFATPFSPFMHASFEVENDLNGINPSNLFSNVAAPNVPIPQQQRVMEPANYTQPSPIPHVGQIVPQTPLTGQYDSLIDAQDLGLSMDTTQPQPQPNYSRKRARGNGGQVIDNNVIDLRAEDEMRNLDDSTFQVYVPPVATPHQPQLGQRQTPVNVSNVRTNSYNTGGHSSGSDTPSIGASDAPLRDEQKKVKHQMTDRQRRAKIKESMDALKALVPLEPNQKADQATIVASSVTLVQNLKDEVAELRAKLQQMELNSNKEASKLDGRRNVLRAATGLNAHQAQMNHLSNSPFTSMMASLNGAGVSMWRIGLTGKIIEVNLVFELVSGFAAAEIVGNTPCGPPLFGSLSIMPTAFLKAFSDVAAIPQINSAGEALEHTRMVEKEHEQKRLQQQQQQQQGTSPGSHHSSSTSSSPQPPLEFPGPNSPFSPNSVDTNVMVKQEVTVNPTSTNQAPGSQASVAPLYANASISNFPVVPQTELENFFPYKCRSLIHAHPRQANSMKDVVQPQPHGNFLVNHLAALPYNHVLKLLCRHHTLWGEILESIVTLCLVRDSEGQPDYIMLLSTPDCRRLLTPATHQKSTSVPFPAQPFHTMHNSELEELNEMRA